MPARFGNQIAARTPFTAQEVAAALEEMGYRRGTWEHVKEWLYPDRAAILPLVVRSVMQSLGLSVGPNTPELFDKALAEIVQRANQLLVATKTVKTGALV